MQIPLQITYIRMNSNAELDSNIRDHAEQLDQRYGRITSCRVVVESPHRHSRRGRLYHVRVDLTIPGLEIVANHDSDLNRTHEDVNVAVRDAFHAARRKLEEKTRRRRGKVKKHSLK